MFTGRKVIYTDVEVIDRSNVVQVLNDSIQTHAFNQNEIDYLYRYYKGDQPILYREKTIRPEICNKLVENRANEIVSFDSGYLMGEPVQYVAGTSDEQLSEAIRQLNSYMQMEDRETKDKELVDWFLICGTSYKMVVPNIDEIDESPFNLFILDPRNTFIVYHNGLGNKPVMGVKFIKRKNGDIIYSVYTKNQYFEIKDDQIVAESIHVLGDIPIVEYPGNFARLGAFEIVLPLLDAINNVASNRLDGVEQFIQSILLLKGVDIDSDDFKAIKEQGGLKVPVDGDAQYLVQELNQDQTQTLVDYMYDTVLTICGIPNRNGGSSTSDTGAAVFMRDGWSNAEANAKSAELMFKRSERRVLRLILNLYDAKLKVSDIEIRFTRRNYENIQEKSQVLTTMLANDKIHPRLAFEHCGMFVDPDLAYVESMKYYEEQEQKLMHELEEENNVQADGQNNSISDQESNEAISPTTEVDKV